MTDRLYQRDSYLRTFSARVVQAGPDGAILDRSAFFPSGGGVVGDEGTLAGPDGALHRVVETAESEAGPLHRIVSPQGHGGLKAGDAVTGALDWARRHTLMRYHTGTHVLTGVMFTSHGVRVTGNQLTPEKGRVDFAFAEFDRTLLESGFQRSNEILARQLEVRVSFVPVVQARARPELFKLETTFRHDLPELRLVEIAGFDIQADGGCHVANLREVGRLVLTKSENKGKANRRVYFVLESPAGS
jgi:Ser-tRNA(Ala) deacylase AlaX